MCPKKDAKKTIIRIHIHLFYTCTSNLSFQLSGFWTSHVHRYCPSFPTGACVHFHHAEGSALTARRHFFFELLLSRYHPLTQQGWDCYHTRALYSRQFFTFRAEYKAIFLKSQFLKCCRLLLDTGTRYLLDTR